MRILIVLLSVFFFQTGWLFADDYRTFTVTTHAQTSSVAVTKYADPFTGEIDEISVYTPSGVTGAVSIAAINPYDSSALVLAANAAVSGRMIWRPRIEAPAVGGATSLTVTNTVTADRFNSHGEKIRAVISNASKTNQEFRIYLKIKN
ncbi:MAG: hypothetical protein PHH96_02195 [Smithellaceae bacterium]|nr:hypothetical protein [Smithellaceae bacterium]MDD5413612.1 hypothetical protein [Smithellaceae bacterium]